MFHLNQASYKKQDFDIMMIFIMNYFVYSMGTRLDVFISAINFGFSLFIGLRVAYARPLDVQSAFGYVIYIFIGLVCTVFFNMVLNFVGEI